MPITIPVPIDALPAAPQPTDTALQFDAKSFALLGALSGLVSQTNAQAVVTTDNASDAAASAQAAFTASLDAASAAGAAMGAAHFKGLWAGLSGALALPATVKHNGRFWLLLSPLADVTAAVPGVSPDWTPLDAGTVPTQVIASNTTAVAGVRYIVAAAAITLTLPASWLKGDYFGVREAIAAGTYTLDFGTTKVRGTTYGSAVLTATGAAIDLNYEDATRGLV